MPTAGTVAKLLSLALRESLKEKINTQGKWGKWLRQIRQCSWVRLNCVRLPIEFQMTNNSSLLQLKTVYDPFKTPYDLEVWKVKNFTYTVS